MRKTIFAVSASAALLLSTAPAASADTLPDCATITSVNCQGTFTNFYRPDGVFVQVVNGVSRGETYWPFRNPTVDAHSAYTDPEAFPSDYVIAKQLYSSCVVDRDRQAVALVEKDAKIARLQARIRHLRARLAHGR